MYMCTVKCNSGARKLNPNTYLVLTITPTKLSIHVYR